MLTLRETQTRLSLYNMGIRRVGSTCDFEVYSHVNGAVVLTTDDLEDAVLTVAMKYGGKRAA